MKRYHIGFNKIIKAKKTSVACRKSVKPKKSIVFVYFAHRGTGWAYYNDKFDLKVGDFVYVEGKLEGYRGQVTQVNYSFKIKLSDYKKVIAVIDTDIKGDFYIADSHIVSFDKNAIPFSKVLTWFKAPESDEDYVSGNDDTVKFSLNDLSKMNIDCMAADRGQDYYIENRVCYLELNGTAGHAIVKGCENYEVEFNYTAGEISNLTCSCFCSGNCKHEYAAMLQLKNSLEFITENYKDKYRGYFALISKSVFMNTVMDKKVSGKISLEA